MESSLWSCSAEENSHHIVRLNHNGVSYLHCGMWEHAAHSFRLALDQLGHFVSAANQSIPAILHSHSETTEKNLTLLFQIQELPCKDHCAKDPVSFADHNTLLLHASSFYFAPAEGTCAMASFLHDPRLMGDTQATRVLSGILLFNLGLSYHLRATSISGDNRWQKISDDGNPNATAAARNKHMDFIRAQQSYNLAACAVQGIPRLQDLSSMEKRVAMAIYNNNAHVSLQLWKIPESEELLSTLYWLLSSTVTDKDHDHHSKTPSNRHFYQNARFQVNQLATLSPAA
ncbi:hypothetical protein ACA910_013824 [Epithemia clementina (nom. ined.)]